MNIEELIHPLDAKALKALKNVPGLPKLMEKIFEYGYDELAWSDNVTTNLRLSETQMPECMDFWAQEGLYSSYFGIN